MRASLLQRRILIVTGKGGAGKTTLTALLGLLAARRGVETALIELARDPALPELLARPDQRLLEGDGREPVRIEPFLSTLHLRPEEALMEYLELQLRVRALVRRVVSRPAFRRLLEAAPGWRELITLGKLWHLATRERDGRPMWQLLIVDAPATGHGLSLLQIPNVVLDTVRMGPLRRQTDRVQALIRDPTKSLVVPVTLTEELPANETLELLTQLRTLGIGVGPVIANGIEPPPPSLSPAVLRALGEVSLGALPQRGTLREIVERARRRAELQGRELERLRRGAGERPVLELRQREEGASDRAGLDALADSLESALRKVELA